MSTVMEQALFEPEDLLTMPDGDRFELVDGQLVERNMSKWSSYVAGNTHQRLRISVMQTSWAGSIPREPPISASPSSPRKSVAPMSP